VALYLHSPNTPSWHDAQLKKAQEQLYLYLYVYQLYINPTFHENQIGLYVPRKLLPVRNIHVQLIKT